jgi:hypothetical protein
MDSLGEAAGGAASIDLPLCLIQAKRVQIAKGPIAATDRRGIETWAHGSMAHARRPNIGREIEVQIDCIVRLAASARHC